MQAQFKVIILKNMAPKKEFWTCMWCDMLVWYDIKKNKRGKENYCHEKIEKHVKGWQWAERIF